MPSRSSIDERIVRMEFDNKQFEAGVRETSKTLDDFKSKLDFKNLGSGLQELDNYGSGTHFSGLLNAVETISGKFSALGILGVTALQRIANQAIQTGETLLRSLAIEPVSQGFNEYELKMNSLQTIMSSTGKDLDTVNGYLEELNKYADRTIYSFSDMTQNIGKFTNTGVELEDAVLAIKGISNEAALSGANAQQASHAMYNFAQALSSGSVKLIDWKSIQNATMDTLEFKEQLIDTAVQLGTLVRQGDAFVSTTTDMNGNISDAFTATKYWNESLSSQWLTSQVLIETLKRYSDETTDLGRRAYAAAQDVKTFSQLMDTLKESVGSGWAQTWELVFGDLNEAKELWTTVNNYLGGFIDQQAKARNELLQGWKDLAGRTRVLDALANIIRYLGDLLAPLRNAFSQIFPPITVQRLVELSEKFLDFSLNLEVSAKSSNRLTKIFKGLFSVFKIGKEALGTLVEPFRAIVDAFRPVGDAFLDGAASLGTYFTDLNKSSTVTKFLEKRMHSLAEAIRSVGANVKSFVDAIRNGESRLTPFINVIKSFFSFLTNTGKKAFTNIQNGIDSLLDKIKGFSFSKLNKDSRGIFANLDIAGSINRKFEEANAAIKKFVDGALEKLRPLERIKSIFDRVSGYFSNFLKNVSESGSRFDYHELLDKFVSFYEKAKPVLQKIASVFKTIVSEISEFVKALLSGMSMDDALNILREGLVGTLIVALIQLVRKFSQVISSVGDSINKVAKNVSGFTSAFKKIFDELATTLKTFQTSIKADALKKIAVALAILAGSLFALSLIEPANLGASLLALGAIFLELKYLLSALNKFDKTPESMNQSVRVILSISAAIRLLTSAVKTLSGLSFGEILNGLFAVLGTLITLVAALNEFDGSHLQKGASSILAMGVSILILSKAVKIFGQMDFYEMTQGLLAVNGIILSIGAAFKGGNGAGLNKSAMGLLSLAASMLILYAAVKKFGEMDFYDLIQGLAAFFGLLAGLGGVANVLDGKKISGAAAGLLILSVAMYAVVGVVALLSKMDFNALVVGMVGLGGTLLMLVGALTALNNLGAGKMLAAAAAITVLSVGCIALAAALLMISQIDITKIWDDVGALVVVLLSFAGAAAILSAVGEALIPVLLSLGGMFALIGVGVLAAGAGVLMFAGGIEKLANLSEDAGKGLHNFIERLREDLPNLGRALGETIDEFAEGAKNAVPKAITMLMDVFISSFVLGLANGLPNLIASGVALITKFIEGLAQAVRDSGPALIDAFYDLINSLIEVIGEALGGAVGLIGSGLASLGKGIFNGFKHILGIDSPSKETQKMGRDIDAGFELGFADGIPSLMNSANGVGDSILGSFSGLGTDFNSVGKDAMSALGNGLDVGSSGLSDAFSNIDLSSLGIDLPEDIISPTISPVLDLSNLDGAGDQISQLLNGDADVSLGLNSSGGMDLGNLISAIQNESGFSNYQPFDDTRILAGMQTINSRLTELETAFASTNVILDSGQLVGALSRKMNLAINQYNSYKRNGVY